MEDLQHQVELFAFLRLIYISASFEMEMILYQNRYYESFGQEDSDPCSFKFQGLYLLGAKCNNVL